MNPTRFCVVCVDGAADEPVGGLDGRTVLEAAATPNLDALVRAGRLGMMRTIPAGLPASGDVAMLSLAGYDPRGGYTGIGPLEAAALCMRLKPREVVLRCDLVTIADGLLVDANGGDIPTEQASALMAELNTRLSSAGAVFETVAGSHHLLRLRDMSDAATKTLPPFQIEGEAVQRHAPRGPGAARLVELMQQAGDVLAAHDVNTVRRDLGENPANAIWLWGGGPFPRWPRFRQRFGIGAAAVGNALFFKGIAKMVHWAYVPAPRDGAAETASLAHAALQALADHAMVVVHAGMVDEASLAGDIDAKQRAIEMIDRDLIGPLADRLGGFHRWRLLVASSLMSSVERRRHSDDAVPFCMCGAGISAGGQADRLTERAASSSDLQIEFGHELMEFFLRT